MLNEDQYLDRTPDLVAKVRAMREAADKEMDRFTRVADYDVRRVVGQGPKAAPASGEIAASPPAVERPKRSAARTATAQTSIEFTPAPAQRSDRGEGS
jgi:hypothetical protein